MFSGRVYSGSGLIILAATGALVASGHAVLYKRDSRGTALWVGLIWLLPFFGPLFYFGFGINRIERRAALLRRRRGHYRAAPDPERSTCPSGALGHLAPLADIVGKVTGRSLVSGNHLEIMTHADITYAAMLAALAEARHSIALSTYIFERDDIGTRFAASLEAAVQRGVAVRVLIDATGTLFSWHPILSELRRRRVPYARFLPAFSVGRPISLNLRNHRKLLIVDGATGFTGGMNICSPHLRTGHPPQPTEDVHFRVRGPVVAHLQDAFADDWFFTTGEALAEPAWFPVLTGDGTMPARGIADGPDENFEKVRWILLAAITAARRSLRILTPYFLPDAALISALNLAAMRGVAVDILLPETGDVPFVQWASAAHWWQLLEHGCRIWVAPPPFNHAKIFLVDETWALVGSSNWDPRSLRLNFEFNLECYDPAFAQALAAYFEGKKDCAHEMTFTGVNSFGFSRRLRNGIARLLTPFL